MADFLRGKWPGTRELPPAVSAFLIGTETGWGYQEIQDMDRHEFKINAKLMLGILIMDSNYNKM